MPAIISGNLTLDKRQLDRIDDHQSLMTHFKREVLAKWGIDEEEYYQMLDEALVDRPKETDG